MRHEAHAAIHSRQIEVRTFKTVQEAEAYLAHIPVLLGRGELDSQTALELSTLTKNWLNSIYARQEYDLKLQAQGGSSDQTIRIKGGMAQLPGTNIIGLGGEEAPPRVNGHNGHGPVIEYSDAPAEPATESINGANVARQGKADAS